MVRIFRRKFLKGSRSCGRVDRRAIRAAALALVLGFAVNVSRAASVSAQEESNPPSSGAPMPPARPPVLAPPSTHVEVPPIQTPGPRVTNEAAVPPWTPGKLLQLPPYTRARMHECALEWQKMKAQGTTAEKIWFTFAQTCLVQ
jgi:hypothetical protein